MHPWPLLRSRLVRHSAHSEKKQLEIAEQGGSADHHGTHFRACGGKEKQVSQHAERPRKCVSGGIGMLQVVLCLDVQANRRAEKNPQYVRENETVAVEPIGVLWVESHELVPEDVGDRGHAHGGARMARVGFDGGIDLESKWC